MNVPARPVYFYAQPAPATPMQPPAPTFATLGTLLPYDFGVGALSPAVDRGASLTVATAAATSSTRLSVAEAGYFHDGYGVTAGDTIVIGSNMPVLVTAVDVANRILTLQSPRTWASGDAVSLPSTGQGLDLGACERGAEMPLCRLR